MAKSKSPKTQLTVYLTKPLAKRLKIYAAKSERRISQVVADSVARFISQEQDKCD